LIKGRPTLITREVLKAYKSSVFAFTRRGVNRDEDARAPVLESCLGNYDLAVWR
jgi:hypothetical protein